MAKRNPIRPVEQAPVDMEAKAKAFIEEYNVLCEKHGLQIFADPVFHQSKDNGTFSIAIAFSVRPIVKE